jgi:photosystem II stability/assembly factor-like uncharacterized protein
VVKQLAETSYYLRDTDFISSTLGSAVGYPHWDQATTAHTGPIILTDIDFIDTQRGWAVGSRSYLPKLSGQVILHTADGGMTWETQHEEAPPSSLLFSTFGPDSVYLRG